jgi:hypothetical protein
MMKLLAAGAALALGMMGAIPAIAAEATWVAVAGPRDWAPEPGYSLEIGDRAYAIDANNGGGVTSVSLSQPTIVRIRQLPDCGPIVRFVAQPGRRYVIRFAATGIPRLEDWTGRGLDAGPALDPGPPMCERLPDTSTGQSTRSSGMEPRAGALVLVGLVSTLLILRRSRRTN